MYEYMNSQRKGSEDPLAAARRVWRGYDKAPGEGQDPYYSLAFGDIDPFDVETLALAEAIYGPMLYHMETVKA